MKGHVLRPLILAAVLVSGLLVVRHFYVPDDFGVQGESFTYNFHRAGSVDEWKKFPVKYHGEGKKYCAECHEDQYESNTASKHGLIQCENCHGPALGHPDDPETLTIDRSRELCLRCHAQLVYPTSQRSEIPGIDPEEHNVGSECSECHNPHNPNLEDM